VCKKESLLNKAYEQEHKLLEKRHQCAQKLVPLTKERCDNFRSLPCQTCCLKNLNDHLEKLLCHGPIVLFEHRDYLMKINSGEVSFPPCSVCGGDLMSRDDSIGSSIGAPCKGAGEMSSAVKGGIEVDLSSAMDLLMFSREEAGIVAAPATCATVKSDSNSSCPNVGATGSEAPFSDLKGFDDVTILQTCAKLFSQNKGSCVPPSAISNASTRKESESDGELEEEDDNGAADELLGDCA
jgi:hypothetical protein